MASFNALRAVANRLTSTPVDELPHQVGYLATSISSCRDVLQTASPSNDQSILLHKLRTRVSALLQDRSPEGRFSGIVIARALIENGGVTFLSETSSWVRSMISCLNKPDTPEVKRLCIITVSRIYLLTINQQALVRDITTPTLPAFISATLGAIKPSTAQIDGKSIRSLSPLLGVVLRSWHSLIEHFAPTIRPNAGSIRSICLSLISDASCPHEVYSTAQEVLARLHFCAPRNAMATEWSQTCSQAIEAAHDIADLVFRAVVEDFTPAIPRTSKVTRKQKAASTPATSSNDVLGLDPWTGITQGCLLLARQVDVLRYFLTSQHVQEVSLPLHAIFDLTARITAVTLPIARFSLRTNSEITREEREELWLNLPRVHGAVLSLFRAMAETFDSALFPVCHTLVTQFWDLFEAESDNEAIKSASYDLVNTMLMHRLLPFSKSDSTNFRRLVQYCCDTLLAQSRHEEDAPSLQNSAASKKHSLFPLSERSALHDSAYRLLPTILTYAPLHKLTGYNSLRTQIDQTAILLNHHEAILASVLHPSRPRTDLKTGRTAAPAPSLIPFLARSTESTADEIHKLASDALLRPRMPVIRSMAEGSFASQDDEEEQDDGEKYVNGNSDDSEAGAENNADVVMVEKTNGLLPVETTPSGRLGLQEFTNAQKRDFTTILEQSADTQLAAPASSDTPAIFHSAQGDAPENPISKRLRISEEAAQETGSIVVAEDRGQHFPYDRPQATTAAETVKPFFNSAETPTTSMADRESMLSGVVMGKEKVGYMVDDSSDSEVPPIDATLVGISDSEDDDDI